MAIGELSSGGTLIGNISAGGLIVGGRIGQRGAPGEQGNGIVSITKTGTSGYVDTYTILYDNGDTDTFNVTNGEKGDPGAIKMIIVSVLPQTGDDDTIYLVPLENPTEEGNNYAEYLYVDGEWELLGKIAVHVDLTAYVKNTDYAANNKGGVIKVDDSYGWEITSAGLVRARQRTYEQYTSMTDWGFVSKKTLENVITGKGLTTKSYVDGLVGDINDALDAINGEVI